MSKWQGLTSHDMARLEQLWFQAGRQGDRLIAWLAEYFGDWARLRDLVPFIEADLEKNPPHRRSRQHAAAAASLLPRRRFRESGPGKEDWKTPVETGQVKVPPTAWEEIDS